MVTAVGNLVVKSSVAFHRPFIRYQPLPLVYVQPAVGNCWREVKIDIGGKCNDAGGKHIFAINTTTMLSPQIIANLLKTLVEHLQEELIETLLKTFEKGSHLLLATPPSTIQ